MFATETDLKDLLAKVAKGDRAALRAIYVRQSAKLFGIAMSLLRDRVVAADVLQAAFLRIWERARLFDPERMSAETWVISVVRHVALNAARRRGREALVEDLPVSETAVEPQMMEALLTSAAGRKMRAGLERLDARGNEALILTYVHGLSHGEMAARMNVAMASGKSLVRRTLLALRDALA